MGRSLPDLGIRPLSARSLALSVLLGSHPPRLPARALVALAELFGIAGGTMRTALSRMATNGEVEVDDSHYRLAGRLLERQATQDAGRTNPVHHWDGSWWVAIVPAERRTPHERRAFRARMAHHRMGELRQGVWLRPANVAGPPAEAELVVTRGPLLGQDPAALARVLWDLDAIAAAGTKLLASVEDAQGWLGEDDPAVLPDTFVVSAAVVRYLLLEPQLPVELVAPDWPAPAVRAAYDRLEPAHRRLMSAFLAEASDPTAP